ncbi:MAG: hypothetical protein WAX04_02060 [Oscillospiraceae bacterium]
MTILKKVIAVGTMVLAISSTSSTAFAASTYNTPAEAVAGITNRTVQSVIDERAQTGKTYGTIAKEAGNLDRFKKENLEMKKSKLNAQVVDGEITQEKADTIIKAIEENQAVCDGTGAAKIGRKMGAKFGSNGTCIGKGKNGGGRGMGSGGQKLRDGSCNVAQ